MVVVLTTAAQSILLPIALKMDGMHLIKKRMGNIFLYYEGDDRTFDQVKEELTDRIDRGTIADFSYDIRPVFMEKVDLSKDMTDEEKRVHPYFNTRLKDLTDQELEAFKRKEGLV